MKHFLPSYLLAFISTPLLMRTSATFLYPTKRMKNITYQMNGKNVIDCCNIFIIVFNTQLIQKDLE